MNNTTWFFTVIFLSRRSQMITQKQIFQTSSRLRWHTFRWAGRIVLFSFLLTIPIVWIAISNGYKPLLPGLWTDDYKKNDRLVKPKEFSANDTRKYQGFQEFLRSHQINKPECKPRINTSRIRAAFYVDWDPQAWFSLQSHIDQLNMVMPDWFFIDILTGKFTP